MNVALFVLAKRFRFESVGFEPIADVTISLFVNEVRVKIHVRR
jgi:hypothetical protein